MTDIKKITTFLSTNDPVLAGVIEQIDLPAIVPSKHYFLRLVESIVSQQLSVKAADTIFGRVLTLFPDQQITPKIVLTIDDSTFRECGLSYAKISYIKNLAAHVIESPAMFEKFDEMGEEEIISELIKVKGIGRWTAEMFLLFTMGRPDIFSYGDLGIRNAIKKLYGLDHNPTQAEAEKIAEKWKPYRSTACRYLWKSLDL